MIKARVLSVLATTLFLSGCFMSKEALITPKNADYPLTKGSHFSELMDCSNADNLICASKGGGDQQMATGIVTIKNGRYAMKYDVNSNAAFSLPAMQNGGNPTFLLKNVGGNLYLAEADSGESAPPGQQDPFGARYLYGFVRIDGKTATVYQFMCEQNGDRRYVAAGRLTKIADAMGVPLCLVKNVDGAAAIFRDRIAAGEKPKEKFVFH